MLGSYTRLEALGQAWLGQAGGRWWWKGWDPLGWDPTGSLQLTHSQ